MSAINHSQDPMRDIVVANYLRDAIMNGSKTHIMVPFTAERGAIIQPGRRLRLETFLNDKSDATYPFATAVAGGVMLLRIDPRDESMYQFAGRRFSHKWEKLPPHLVLDIIRAEGAAHKDNFWQRLYMKGRTECLRVEITQLIPLLSVTP